MGMRVVRSIAAEVCTPSTKCVVAVLPSGKESLPKSQVETAVCRQTVPIIDTAVCRDSIIANEKGLLVLVKNPQVLADAIEILCNDQQLRKRQGAAGRQITESELDINALEPQHIMLYRTLVET